MRNKGEETAITGMMASQAVGVRYERYGYRLTKEDSKSKKLMNWH